MANPTLDLFYEELKRLCLNNAEYYKKDDSEHGQRLRLGFLGIVDHISTILPMVNSIQKVMSGYDFDENTPGNGYRSYVILVQATFKHALQISNYVAINRDSLIFRKGFYMKEVEAVAHMIASLATCFQFLHSILNWSEPGELFPSSDHVSQIVLDQSDTVNQYPFYGRCLGIQFCSSVQPLLRFISTFMASFSEVYYNLGSFSAKAQSFVSGGKFLIDPELRARRIVNISQHASVDFCKSFWFLAESELMKKIPDFVCNSVAINAEIEIPPEPLTVNTTAGAKVEIPIPSSHIKISPIQVRLLSSIRREGMISVSSESNKKNPVFPASEYLILHCHGGGFVAQSSKSHEVYLRDWATSLNAPILSVDYSLAPEAPFPRALEEVFYTYCWSLKNSHILGTTAEKIILAGDSAGANLVLGVALKSIEFGIKKPHGLFLAYVPVIISSTPSPSRLLSLMDPLLPIGFLLRCLKAYACPSEQNSKKHSKKNGQGKKTISGQLTNFDTNSNDNPEMQVLCQSGPTNPICNVPQCSKKLDNNFQSSSCDAKKICDTECCENVEKILAYNSRRWSSQDGQFLTVDNEATAESIDETDKNVKNTFNTMRKRVSNLFSNTFKMASRKDIDKTLTGNDLENLVNPFKEFKFSVPRDPFLSPYWAPDDMLSQLPPTSICSVQFDPCLDDCVMFAKKLNKLGNVITLDILEGLPHGFLNFAKANKDAEEGSKLCVERIKELLNREVSKSESSQKKNGEIEHHLAEQKPETEEMVD